MKAIGPQLLKILVEVFFIVLAVVLALAVDQWSQDRENARLGERMLSAVAQEIESNRAKLLNFGQGNDPDSTLAALQDAVATFRAGDQPRALGVNWNVTLLSTAAWETAQLTRATQFMELDQAIDLAEVYEFQRFYGTTQDGLVAVISSLEARMEGNPVPAILELRSRYANAVAQRRTLAAVYACALVRLDRAASLNPDDCPTGDASDASASDAASGVPGPAGR